MQVFPPPSPVNVQPSPPAAGVSDWIKLPLVAILALAGGMLLERSRMRDKRQQMENSVYKELARNYLILVGTLETVQINSGTDATHWATILDDIKTDRYQQAKSDFLFDEITGSADIEQVYRSFGVLQALPDAEDRLAFAESLVGRIEDHVDRKKLDRKLFGRYIPSDQIKQKLKL